MTYTQPEGFVPFLNEQQILITLFMFDLNSIMCKGLVIIYSNLPFNGLFVIKYSTFNKEERKIKS